MKNAFWRIRFYDFEELKNIVFFFLDNRNYLKRVRFNIPGILRDMKCFIVL